ncbi:MAG TPA: lysophospholipid acyltransferase family protein [Kiritimatiellia bacterium]|nr:lysophospholipid acyltransferase family protein [Kiritimatiellia bacterium]HRZ13268.1 lysophospholipid acyltransferase family protein [Kiritimatiellia bacterium]HSA18717.1 lysophospholipid acyltransferase family protein [Kiritimatiellia bacterium]
MKDRCLLYRFVRGSTAIWLKVWLKLESHGAENVPAAGGCVLASNHASYLDPPIVACGLKHRIVRFMARDTLFAGTFRNWFFHGIRCVPLDRTRGDVAALRKGIQILKEGEVLGLFPEGTRSPDGQLKPAKGGIGFLVAKAGVPVVPVYVGGSFEAFPKGAQRIRRGKVFIYYGQPIAFEEIARLGQDRDSYQAIGDLIMSKIAHLREQALVSPR